jgi:stage II sporulation protein AA (anti-sigma F factor antagonist)
MALTTTVQEAAGRVPITVLSLDGELDASNFEELVEEVQDLYDTGSRHLLLDLSALTFLASSGLVALHSMILIMRGESSADPDAGWGAFHSLSQEVSGGSKQAGVQLAAPQPGVERVLQRTGMDRLFPIHLDRATAIAAF